MHKRSISIAGHRTSISLEPLFWTVLEEEAAARNMSLPQLIGRIDKDRIVDMHVSTPPNLTSALRVFALDQALKRNGG